MRDIWIRKHVPYRAPFGPTTLRHNYVQAWSYIRDGVVLVNMHRAMLACALLKEYGADLRVQDMQLHNATCPECCKVFHDFYTNYTP